MFFELAHINYEIDNFSSSEKIETNSDSNKSFS